LLGLEPKEDWIGNDQMIFLKSIVRDRLRLFKIIWDYLRLFEIIWDYLRLFEIIWDYLRLFEIIWDYSAACHFIYILISMVFCEITITN
jgi:hypothetical protein